MSPLELKVGTSGFSYDEWRGSFYPEELAASEMLRYYATQLPSVEVNNTFYRMPRKNVLEDWRNATPETFRFVLKASRRITHIGRLRNVSDSVAYLLDVSSVLGEKLGALLFQLPPHLKKDETLLAEFVASLPAGCKAAFEFRHPTWYDDAVYSILREKNAALCVGDAEEGDRSPPFVATADWGYLRLRAADYDQSAVRTWFERIQAQSWTVAYAFFKHEQKGPALAKALLEGGVAPIGPGLAKPAAPPPTEARPGLKPARAEPAAKRVRAKRVKNSG